jgi:hypothetical protein
MPRVTVNPESYERFDLETAPPDGFVMLRPLPYGQKLSRRSKATKMMMRSSAPTGRSRRNQQPQDSVFELESMDEWAVAHDFAYCIGEHNLQDANENLLDFTKPMALKMLDPKVGSEIERLIDELNNEEGEETLEDFLARSTTSSVEGKISSDKDGSETTPTLAR